jgi:hypothetical protein
MHCRERWQRGAQLLHGDEPLHTSDDNEPERAATQQFVHAWSMAFEVFVPAPGRRRIARVPFEHVGDERHVLTFSYCFDEIRVPTDDHRVSKIEPIDDHRAVRSFRELLLSFLGRAHSGLDLKMTSSYRKLRQQNITKEQ